MEDPEDFQVQPSALHVTVKGIHEAVTKIAGCLSHLVGLVHQASSIGYGLMLLDTHVLELDSDNKNPGLTDIDAWQPCLRELRTETAAAQRLWEASVDGIEGRARIEFARTSKGQATCAELGRGTYHEVLIAIGRLVIDTDDAGAVQQNELGMAAPRGSNNPKTVRGTIRLHVARALATRDWWQPASTELDREYGDVLSPPGTPSRHRPSPKVAPPITASVHPEGEAAPPPNQTGTSSRTDQISELSPGLFRSGNGWVVQFKSGQAALKDMVGIRQLQQLLASPQIPISATVLDGLQDSARQTVQLIADATTIRALQQKLRDVQQDLDKPNYPLTHEAEEALFHQRDQIKAELKSVTGPKRLRSMKSEQSNSTNRVRAAIRRAVNHVGEALPELGDHLRACLRDMNGANPCYYPDSPIVWRVNA